MVEREEPSRESCAGWDHIHSDVAATTLQNVDTVSICSDVKYGRISAQIVKRETCVNMAECEKYF